MRNRCEVNALREANDQRGTARRKIVLAEAAAHDASLNRSKMTENGIREKLVLKNRMSSSANVRSQRQALKTMIRQLLQREGVADVDAVDARLARKRASKHQPKMALVGRLMVDLQPPMMRMKNLAKSKTFVSTK